MDSLILNLESDLHLNNSYQITDSLDDDENEVFVIWVSTGMISGHYLKELNGKKCYFNTIVEAMKALVKLIEEDEHD